MEQSTTIDIEAPVEQVWEVLREVERWPEWAPTVTSVRGRPSRFRWGAHPRQALGRVLTVDGRPMR